MIVPNWREILRKAWSLRFMELAAVMSGVEIVLPIYSDAIPRGTFAALSFLSVIGAYIARFMAQKETHGAAE